MPWYKKSKMTKNSNQGGPALNMVFSRHMASSHLSWNSLLLLRHYNIVSYNTTLAKNIETGTQAKQRRVHARQITRLCHVRAVVSIFLARVVYRPYFPRPRKYRRLFSEPSYWPRRSRGQYGEGNIQAGIFEAEGNKSLIPGRLARSPLTCASTQ